MYRFVPGWYFFTKMGHFPFNVVLLKNAKRTNGSVFTWSPGNPQAYETLGERFGYFQFVFSLSVWERGKREEASSFTQFKGVEIVWGKLFYLQLELFCLQLRFFAYSPLRPLLDALSRCKQKSSNCK